ncbi:MAG: magnesium/cobalt transporter CorA [Nonlabens sp.]|uniref:magnesium/cobalt transporter CorA n=1 Tax=Nonlabens sp. TaxID=1888209 RepID=UPI003EF8ECC0
MARKRKRKATPKSRNSVFQPPGTISYVGIEREGNVATETIIYNEQSYEKFENIHLNDLKKELVHWFNIDGVHDIELLEQLGKDFNLHHLLVEDIANTTQRPKTEFFDECIFQSIKMISYDAAEHELNEEQVSILLTKNSVITFQEKTGDVFENIRERIESSRGRIRTSSNDYLFYSLIDSIIDHYFIAVEQIGEYLNDLEDEIFEEPDKESLNKVQRNKRLLLSLRRAIYPLRESISKILKEQNDLIDPKIVTYFHDAYDHCIQITETIESYREINTGLKDMYLSSVSHKMNQIMQVLTIVSSIFIPMTFVAGIYGMNFEYIPELTWEHGYQYFWIINVIIFVTLISFFKWKKWL